MKVKVKKNLAPIRAEALDAIEAWADRAFAQYVTPGREQVYRQKEEEAKRYQSSGSIGTLLKKEADMRGITPAALAQIWTEKAATVRQAWMDIEVERQARRLRVDQATDEPALRAIIALAEEG